MTTEHLAREPLCEGVLLVIQSARDRLATELQEMDAGRAPRLPAKKLKALRTKIQTLDAILAEHGLAPLEVMGKSQAEEPLFAASGPRSAELILVQPLAAPISERETITPVVAASVNGQSSGAQVTSDWAPSVGA